MKITKLKLKNVVTILRGLGLYEFELDFTKTNHIFNILGGTNGSGKTSILNALSPFANEVILTGMKGEKEICIYHKGNEYMIHHYYEPSKTGHTVHSYIAKKEKNSTKFVELNSNGNVGDFKKTVEIELGVNAYIMKLIKLGNDMSGIIKMTPVERKKFISSFTSDTDIYLAKFKKVSADCAFLNKTIDSSKDKLNMLGDEVTLNGVLETVSKNIDDYNNKIIELSNKVYNNEQILEENKSKFNKERYNLLHEKLQKISDINTIEKYREEYGDMIDSSVDKLISKKKELEISNLGLQTNINILENNEHDLRKDIDGYLNEQLSELTIERDKCDCDYTMDELNELIVKNEESLKKIENNIDQDYDTYTIDYILNISKFFDNTAIALDAIYPQLESDNLTDDMLDPEKIQKNTLELQSKRASLYETKERIKINIRDFNKEIRFNMFREELCRTCPLAQNVEFKEVYTIEQFENMLHDINIQIEEIDKKLEINYELLKLARIYIRIIDFISGIDKKIVEKLAITKDEVGYKIKHTYTQLINKIILQSIIDKITSNIEYKNIKCNLEILYKDKEKANEYINIINKIRDISVEVDNKTNKIKEIKTSSDLLRINQAKNTKIIEDLEYIIEYRKIKDEYNSYKEEYETLNKINELISSYNIINMALKNQIREHKSTLNNYEDKKNKILYNLKQIHEIKDSIEKYQDLYMEMKMIKDALSIKEGIPLKYVQKFLSDTREIANHFIKLTFSDTIRLGKFVINDKEFRIPIEGHGQDNTDINTASSGERAIISLALSLALLKQSKSKFKILYLDELDGPLDAEKRRIFLHLLDEQIKEMKIKQVFVITHNNAFSDQPANLILLKDNDIEVNENIQTVLFRY